LKGDEEQAKGDSSHKMEIQEDQTKKKKIEAQTSTPTKKRMGRHGGNKK
jgi:hypothetical protein